MLNHLLERMSRMRQISLLSTLKLSILLATTFVLLSCSGGNAGSGNSGSPYSQTPSDPDATQEEQKVSVPVAPSGLTAQAAVGQVTLSWDAVADAVSYTLYWSQSSVNDNWTAIADIPASPYVHTGLVNGTMYYYKVTAVNSLGESTFSNLRQATPMELLPTAPANPRAVPGFRKNILRWDSVEAAASYRIYFSVDGSNFQTIPVLNNYYIHSSLDNGTTYYYYIVAVGQAGEGTPSISIASAPFHDTSKGILYGGITAWAESKNRFIFDNLVTIIDSQIEIDWSYNSYNPDRGWYYPRGNGTEIAWVPDIADISEVTDAAQYTYSTAATGPANEGDFLFLRNLQTGFYAAIRLDNMYPHTDGYPALDATWYLQTNGSTDFSTLQTRNLINIAQCIDDTGELPAGITSLSCTFQSLEDLTGIEELLNLSRLDINNNLITNISPLESLTSLVHLKVDYNDVISLAPLANHTVLANLDASNNRIADITAVASLANLKSLRLNENSISSIAPLTGNKSLEHVYMNKNTISDLSPLSEISSLKTIELSHNNIQDLSPLQALPNLQTLVFATNNIPTLAVLADKTELVRIDFLNNNISNIEALTKLTKLTHVDLSFNNISNINPLSELMKLTMLRLGQNNISDISPLAKLGQITTLYIDNNNINSLGDLVAMTQLQTLSAGSNIIQTIGELRNFPLLQNLFLNNNQIVDINILSELPQLEWLTLGLNQVVDIQSLASLTKMRSLTLAANRIVDVSALANLTNLVDLNLADNMITTGVDLLVTLTNAQSVDLTGNTNIPCTHLDQLTTALGVGIVKPPVSCIP